jgi:tripeptidyl-peptidase-1
MHSERSASPGTQSTSSSILLCSKLTHACRFRFRYGAHLTKEQVAQLVAPHPDTLKLVSSWLQYNGVPPSSISTTHGGGWLTVADVPVSKANKILGASYRLYYHAGTNETILRTVGYALPAALHIHVQTIAPTTAFMSIHLLQPEEMPRNRSGGGVNDTSGEPVNMLSRRQPEPPNEYIDPSILRSLYGTVQYSPSEMDQNKIGILGYGNEYPSSLDLREFLTRFRTDAVDAKPTIETMNVYFSGRLGMIANSDVQYTVALAYPTPVIYYLGTGKGVRLKPGSNQPAGSDLYLQWFNHMADESDTGIPKTIALGYGFSEPSIPKEYATALCKLFAQLGARGVSILVSSDNAGVGLGDCKDTEGNVQFYTTFPASCMSVSSQVVHRGRYKSLTRPS